MKLVTLLCCINPNGSMDDIDEFTFYQMINPIVPVLNIKIFDKTSQVKAFVQIESEEHAELAVNDLHGKQMNIGKIKVFISHKKFVAFEKSLPEILAQANRSSISYVDVDEYTHKIPALGGNPYFNNSVAEPKSKPQTYSSWKTNAKPAPTVPNYSDKVLYSKPSKLDYEAPSNPYVKKKTAPVAESQREFRNTGIQSKKQIHAFVEPTPEPVVSERKVEKAPKGASQAKFVKVANIDMKNVSCQMLFNLFGCFGNVAKLIIHETAGFAVLEYQSDKAVNTAIKYTDCIKLCAKTLSVTAYSGPDLFSETNPNSRDNLVLYANAPNNYRFSGESTEQSSPPSRTLQFSNLPQTTTAADIRAFVSKIHPPLSVTACADTGAQAAAFLVEFNFLYEGFKVLSMLHNSEIEQHVLSVSFFRRKSNAP